MLFSVACSVLFTGHLALAQLILPTISGTVESGVVFGGTFFVTVTQNVC